MIELNTSQSISKLRISGIVDESIVDGPGIRLTVFTQGCNHKCPGCHNPQTHDYNGGVEISIDDILNMIKENPLLDGITISGGEPFDQAKSCTNLAKKVKDMGLNVVIYTGYNYEYLMSKQEYKDLLLETDILVDGRFDMRKMDLTIPFKGSTNQRIIDVNKSIVSNKISIA
ncbi:MAG: anaerobic ribonucleoside-triphosphate reductase activating protein [Tissierellaceae bacterium]|nr:anaerobic ribonucleoside-triphosphate reductase activating protein [Tissierellaceae bacterium]